MFTMRPLHLSVILDSFCKPGCPPLLHALWGNLLTASATASLTPIPRPCRSAFSTIPFYDFSLLKRCLAGHSWWYLFLITPPALRARLIASVFPCSQRDTSLTRVILSATGTLSAWGSLEGLHDSKLRSSPSSWLHPLWLVINFQLLLYLCANPWFFLFVSVSWSLPSIGRFPYMHQTSLGQCTFVAGKCLCACKASPRRHAPLHPHANPSVSQSLLRWWCPYKHGPPTFLRAHLGSLSSAPPSRSHPLAGWFPPACGTCDCQSGHNTLHFKMMCFISWMINVWIHWNRYRMMRGGHAPFLVSLNAHGVLFLWMIAHMLHHYLLKSKTEVS